MDTDEHGFILTGQDEQEGLDTDEKSG